LGRRTSDEQQVQAKVPKHVVPCLATGDDSRVVFPVVFFPYLVEIACPRAIALAPHFLLGSREQNERKGHAKDCKIGKEYGNKTQGKIGEGYDE
jgi:hypothetical protein